MLEGFPYATGEEQKTTANSPRKNLAGPKHKRHSILYVSADESKIWCCKEQYWIGNWNIRSMNQGKLDVVKQEMVRIGINILELSELKWTTMGKFNSDDHYIYYCGQESHRRNGVAFIINKRVWNAVLGCNLKNNRIILVCFQGKPFNIIVILIYVPATSDKEADQFYEDLEDRLELTSKKDVLFIFDWNWIFDPIFDWDSSAKLGSQELTPRQVWPWSTKWSRERLIEFFQEDALLIANTPFQQQKKQLYTWTSPNGQYQLDYIQTFFYYIQKRILNYNLYWLENRYLSLRESYINYIFSENRNSNTSKLILHKIEIFNG